MNNTSGLWARATAFFNQGGGPWGGRGSGDGSGDGDGGSGGGPRNPWAQPPSGSKKGSRGSGSVDDLAQKMRERFGGGGGTGGSGGGPSLPRMPSWPVIRLFLIFAAVLWFFFTSIWQIGTNERGVVTRLGAYSRTIDSGVGYTLPWPFETVTKVNTSEVRTLKIPEATSGDNLVLTGDQNIIDLDYSVRWSIASPELFQFQLKEPEETIREVAESSMRAVISGTSLAGAIGAKRDVIEAEVARRMRVALGGYGAGVRIEGVSIINASPPSEVNEAFKDVTAAQQMAQSDINNANNYAQQTKRKAEGEAAAFDRFYVQYKAAPGVTRRRMYYETMEEVLSNVDKTIIEAPGVTPFLPLPALARKLPDTPTAGATK